MNETTAPTIQQRMKAKLEQVGLPYKEVKVFGGQIIITSHCRDTAERWSSVLAKFARVQNVLEAIDDAKVNKNTTLRPSKVTVWRTYARID